MRKTKLLFVLLLALLPFIGWAQQNYNGQHVSIKQTTGDSIQYNLDFCHSGFRPFIKDGKVQWTFKRYDMVNSTDDYWSYNYHFTLDNVESIDFRSFEYDDKEARKALIEFYQAMDGDKWEHNENWCSDKPIWEWYGVNTNGGGIKVPWVSDIWISCNNLSGKLPENMHRMGPIESLGLSGNNIEGELPASLGNIYTLQTLDFPSNKLTGTIPETIAKLPNLFTFDVAYNHYEGPLPEAFLIEYMNHTNRPGNNFYMKHNYFSGKVPQSVQQHRRFADCWPSIVLQSNPLDVSDLVIPAPVFTAKDTDGNMIDLAGTYKKNKYTLLYMWGVAYNSSLQFNQKLIPAYKAYKDKGLEVIGIHYDYNFGDLVESGYLENNDIPWVNMMRKDWENWEQVGEATGLFSRGGCPAVYLVDQDGHIVFNSVMDKNGNQKEIPLDENYPYEVFSYLEDKLGPIEYEYYTSTDYSHDGEFVTLQKATKGSGFDLVFVGEGFTDKDIEEGGRFDQRMNEALEQFFAYEPYTSLRDRFNVYAVKTVSPNAEFVDGCTHAIDVDYSKALEYASKVTDLIPDRPMRATVVYNNASGGRSYCMMMEDDSYVCFAMDGITTVLNHESGGHGIGKLLDEYVEDDGQHWTAIPEEQKTELDNIWSTLGWGANVDWRSDPTEVKWAKFINDVRYADEGIGVYEGSYLYMYGAYRPTENSMMRYNDVGFNAPSREEIYKRVMKESEGDGWTYDYETFVAFDAAGHSQFVNALNAGQTRRRGAPTLDRQQLTAPPVFLKGTWRDAMNKNKK